MASSTPSRARIANVGEALAALVHKPGRIVAGADGGFSVESLAELLAEQGATSHQIMSVLAHTQSETREIYTKGAERIRLATAAMDAIAGFRIG